MNKIDLSCIVGSQVLCEFWDVWNKHLGFLDSIKDGDFIDAEMNHYSNCRIYQHPEYWISNQHGELKLPDGLIINIARRDADEDYDQPSDHIELRHIFANDGQDVIAVQVTGVADGWEW